MSFHWSEPRTRMATAVSMAICLSVVPILVAAPPADPVTVRTQAKSQVVQPARATREQGQSDDSPIDPTASVRVADAPDREPCNPRPHRLRLNATRFAHVVDCTGNMVFRHRDLRITLSQHSYGDVDGARAIVETPGSPALRLEPMPSGWGISMMVGHIDRARHRYVMFEGYDGGMHCCADVYVVVADGPDRGVFPVAAFEAGTEISMDQAPVDVDGDGRTDFVGGDNRFFYEFTSYSGMPTPPPRIWNIRRGRLVDVSAEPRYRPLFRQSAAEARRECLDPRFDHAGLDSACPVYIASAMRAGNFDGAWRAMLRVYDSQAADGGWCAFWHGEIPRCRDFITHLLSFLHENGYASRREVERGEAVASRTLGRRRVNQFGKPVNSSL